MPKYRGILTLEFEIEAPDESAAQQMVDEKYKQAIKEKVDVVFVDLHLTQIPDLMCEKCAPAEKRTKENRYICANIICCICNEEIDLEGYKP